LPHDPIVLVTCRAWPELSVSDRCLADALAQRGYNIEAARANGAKGPFHGAASIL